MSAVTYIAAGAIGMPALILVGLALCGGIVLAGERLGVSLGLSDDRATDLGMLTWFTVIGAAVGGVAWWGAAA